MTSTELYDLIGILLVLLVGMPAGYAALRYGARKRKEREDDND